ncbi:hypothetical protein FI667_g14418, partial [Globisporangium splendens]
MRMWNRSSTFDLKAVNEEDDAVLEVYTQGKGKKPLIVNELKLASCLSARSLVAEGGAKGCADGQGTCKLSPHQALWQRQNSPTVVPRRVSYYYDTTKNVYGYATSFRVVSRLARLGDPVQTWCSRHAGHADNKVDATISTAVTKLFVGQQYVLKKKDDVVDTASIVASKGTSTVSAVVSTTVSGVVKAKNYTTSTISNVSSAAYHTVVNVKDYTTTQVVNVSSSTYGTVKGATVYVLSHVPYLGSKIRV